MPPNQQRQRTEGTTDTSVEFIVYTGGAWSEVINRVIVTNHCYRPHYYRHLLVLLDPNVFDGWLGSRVVSVLDSGAEGPGFKSKPRRCRVTVLGKLFTPIVPLFTKQRNW